MRCPDHIVLGTAALGGVWGPIDHEESVSTILTALELGIPAIDTAPAYGKAEEYVGEALRQWDGPKPRISTKIGRLRSFSAREGIYDYSERGMMKSMTESLTHLGLENVDIIFLHDPTAIDPSEAERIVGTLIKIKQGGLAKKIGIGGNPAPWCKPFIEEGLFDVMMEYNRLNAVNTEALEGNLKYCQQLGIEYYAASPLFMGLLGKKFEEQLVDPPEWLNDLTIRIAREIKALSDKEGLSLTELAHRFLVSLPASIHMVIGPSNTMELRDTWAQLAKGPLPELLTEEIIRYSQTNSF